MGRSHHMISGKRANVPKLKLLSMPAMGFAPPAAVRTTWSKPACETQLAHRSYTNDEHEWPRWASMEQWSQGADALASRRVTGAWRSGRVARSDLLMNGVSVGAQVPAARTGANGRSQRQSAMRYHNNPL